jgi:hypothetical protein
MANGFGAGDLTWAENPKFERADLEGDSRGYKLVGRKWLVGQLERRMNQLPTAGFPTTGGPLACDGCAQSVPFGDSGLSLVPWIIPDLDGKGRFRMDYEHERQCQLYDPGKKQLGRVAGMFGAERRALSWTVATCGAYDFDPSGRAVLTETSACDETGCVTIDGYTEGWLIGSVEVELPRP